MSEHHLKLTTSLTLPERVRTSMIIPTSEKTFFNTNWKPKQAQLCAYDMLFHPHDYNPKSARSDRQEPKMIRKNIWDQEYHKGIPATTYFRLGRPKWKPLDLPTKEYVRVSVKNENPHMRINDILEWAVLIYDGKPSTCV